MNMQFVPAFEVSHRARVPAASLDAEITGPAELLPYGQRCGIHFEINGTITLFLGMRDPRWADASSYLADLVATKLGVPLEKLRIFYTGMQPAVRRAPVRPTRPLTRQGVGHTTAAVGDFLAQACEVVMQRARQAQAHLLGADPRIVRFDRLTGHVRCDGEEPVTLIDLARNLRHSF